MARYEEQVATSLEVINVPMDGHTNQKSNFSVSVSKSPRTDFLRLHQRFVHAKDEAIAEKMSDHRTCQGKRETVGEGTRRPIKLRGLHLPYSLHVLEFWMKARVYIGFSCLTYLCFL